MDNFTSMCTNVIHTKTDKNGYVIKHCDNVYQCIKEKWYEKYYCPFYVWHLP